MDDTPDLCYPAHMSLHLIDQKKLSIRQRTELGEVALGFEGRNKYEILDTDERPLGFAAEQGKGFLGWFFRQALGHWRSFEIHVFDAARSLAIVARHPFRFLFQRLEVTDASGRVLGAIQQRFGILRKRFDILGPEERLRFQMSSPIWKIWTFPIYRDGREVAVIRKRWSGLLKEALTDADNFTVDFEADDLGEDDRALVLCSALFVDLLYFEKKARR